MGAEAAARHFGIRWNATNCIRWSRNFSLKTLPDDVVVCTGTVSETAACMGAWWTAWMNWNSSCRRRRHPHPSLRSMIHVSVAITRPLFRERVCQSWSASQAEASVTQVVQLLLIRCSRQLQDISITLLFITSVYNYFSPICLQRYTWYVRLCFMELKTLRIRLTV